MSPAEIALVSKFIDVLVPLAATVGTFWFFIAMVKAPRD